MTQQELEQIAWDIELVNPAVKLYLLALIRSHDPDQAARMAGLDDQQAATARGWLSSVGVLGAEGNVVEDVISDAQRRERRLSALAA